jgi:hypothetical protein
MWDLADETIAPLTPAADRRHVGLDPGLIDQHEPLGINPLLIAPPAGASSGDVGSVLLARVEVFFTAQALAVEERPHRTLTKIPASASSARKALFEISGLTAIRFRMKAR